MNGQLHKVGKEVPLGTRLVDYLRDVAGLKGTKYMCREGGCGVCTVTVKSTHPVTKEDVVYSVNAVSFHRSVSKQHKHHVVTDHRAVYSIFHIQAMLKGLPVIYLVCLPI